MCSKPTLCNLNAQLTPRQKKILWRSRHRGTKELDILVFKLAEKYLQNMNESELDELEQVLELPEPLLQHWFLNPDDIDDRMSASLKEKFNNL